MLPKDRIIVALDVPTSAAAFEIVDELAPHVGSFKIGLEAITAGWAHDAARRIVANGGKVGWDGKWDDIPNTVGAAAREAAKLGVTWANVHASAPMASIEKAVEKRGDMKIYGVTVLTAMSPQECLDEVFMRETNDAVLAFALRLAKAKAQGVICSPKELPSLSKISELAGMDMVTPGIRPLWSRNNDQERVTTPRQAILDGATYLVIGRPIVQAAEYGMTRLQAVESIVEEIEMITAGTGLY